jgi:choline dehydrogenase
LTETVLVIEYGKIESTPAVFDPPSAGSRASTWEFQSLPIPSLNNRTASVSVGKVVGGSSAVNGMFFDRGSKQCYDAWTAVGSPEFDSSTEKWNWDGIYPFFKKV